MNFCLYVYQRIQIQYKCQIQFIREANESNKHDQFNGALV